MKKHILGLIVFCQMLIVFALSAKAQGTTHSSLSVAVVHSNASTIAQISFAGKQGHSGIVRVYNAQKQLVKEYHIELIASPYYSSIDISALAKNKAYTIELTTDEGIKESSLLSL